MNKYKIILVGGGGHCKSCIEVIESEGKYKIEGVLDLPEFLGTSTLGYPVIGKDDDIPQLVEQGYSFLVTMGHLGNASRRNWLFDHLKSLHAHLPAIVAPSAFVSKRAIIKEGTIVFHNSIINADAIIGENCIINNKALIEHDANIGNHCHISTGAVINGECTISNHCFIGSGAVVKNGVSIAAQTTIGASALVVKNISIPGTYIGVPAKQINSK